jgi:mRNA-degrading endonuclease YafQ of YafQ-DinJ toxin-antitoxin module
MRIKTIQVTNLFEKHYRKLPKRAKEEAQQKELLFRENPFDPALRTHKLHGKDKDAYAFWISHSWRIKFIFLDEDSVLFLDVGTHDIYS